MLALSLIAGLFHLAQLRREAGAFRLGLRSLAIEVRLTVGELPRRRRQRDVVLLLRILQGGVRTGELERERRFALDQPGNFSSRQLMLAPSPIAGLFHLAQLRGEVSAFRLSLRSLTIEMRLAVGELPRRRRQRDVVLLLRIPQSSVRAGELGRERRFALDQPRDLGSRQLMLAPSPIAGLFHLAQLRREAGAFRLGLRSLAIEVRLTVGELAAAVARRRRAAAAHPAEQRARR